MLRVAELLLILRLCCCASFLDDIIGPIAAIIKTAEEDFIVNKVDGSENSFLPCFSNHDCSYGGVDWICSADTEAFQWIIATNAAREVAGRTVSTTLPGTGSIQGLEEELWSNRRGRIVPQISRPYANRAGVSRLPPAPSSSSPLYEEHLKRTMWGAMRAALTREKMGVCVPANFRVRETQILTGHQVEKFKPTVRLGIKNQAPIDFSMPSVLRQSLSFNPMIDHGKPQLGTLIMESLGVFQCYPLTKVGRHISNDHSNNGEGAGMVPSAFLVQYVPLIVSRSEDAGGSLLAHRLIAEPYEFGVAYDRLKGLHGSGDEFPNRVIMHQSDLTGVLSAISELVSVAQLHPNLDEHLSRLQVYLDANHLRLLQPIVEHFSEDLTFYMSFKELNGQIGLGSGAMPMSCESGAGESNIKVEISGFLPHPLVIGGLQELLWPGVRARSITVRHFLEAAKKSTLDQSICSVRIICLNSEP